MNLNKLWEFREYICVNGSTMTSEQTILLQNSLFILQNENHFSSTFYWGQICGTQKDYLIAYGFQKDAIQDRKMFYSVDLNTWNLLPQAKNKYRHLALLSVTPFRGDPTLKIKILDESLEDTNLDKCKEITEEKRLAGIVSVISEEAEICARGQFLKKPDGSVILNDHFCGLITTEAIQMTSYSHLRIPQHRWNINLLKRDDYNYSFDFLDSIDRDVPSGCWNMSLERGATLVCIRSLYWPGMLFFHKIGTSDVGFVYMGCGKKNLDVCNHVLTL